jgi:L-alanine-DL-glutamate epimerase-like enolase superfamily enzyme
MKIVDVKASRYLKEVDAADFGVAAEIVVTEIATEGEINGVGFLSLIASKHGAIGDAYVGLINGFFRNFLVGRDAFATEATWDEMYRQTVRWGRLGIALQCISMVDVALWDIKAKASRVPLWKLLGGPSKDNVPLYANTAQNLPPDELAARAAEYVGMGFKAIKIRGAASVVSAVEATQRVAAVREAIGPDVKLMVDVNGTWNVVHAVRMLREWEPYDVFWLEEPVPPDDVEGYRQVREVARTIGTNIAGGEQHGSSYDFRVMFERDALDIAQPDVGECGGITEFLRIVSMARGYSVAISPHTVQHVHNHLVAALPGLMWVEFFMGDNELRDFTLELLHKPVEALKHENGVLPLPEALGLGVELNPEIAERFRVS